MLKITMTDPPHVCSVGFEYNFSNEFVNELYMCDIYRQFSDIDSFLLAAIMGKESKIYIDCETESIEFEIVGANGSTVDLLVSVDKLVRRNMEYRCSIPIHNLLYEFGKMLSVKLRLMMDNEYANDSLYVPIGWKQHLDLKSSLLTTTIVEPPYLGKAVIQYDLPNGLRFALGISSERPPFRDIDRFLYMVSRSRKTALLITNNTEWVKFEAQEYEFPWLVHLRVTNSQGGEGIYILPTYNIYYEFGKILSIRSWLMADGEVAFAGGVEGWKRHHGLL